MSTGQPSWQGNATCAEADGPFAIGYDYAVAGYTCFAANTSDTTIDMAGLVHLGRPSVTRVAQPDAPSTREALRAERIAAFARARASQVQETESMRNNRERRPLRLLTRQERGFFGGTSGG